MSAVRFERPNTSAYGKPVGEVSPASSTVTDALPDSTTASPHGASDTPSCITASEPAADKHQDLKPATSPCAIDGMTTLAAYPPGSAELQSPTITSPPDATDTPASMTDAPASPSSLIAVPPAAEDTHTSISSPSLQPQESEGSLPVLKLRRSAGETAVVSATSDSHYYVIKEGTDSPDGSELSEESIDELVSQTAQLELDRALEKELAGDGIPVGASSGFADSCASISEPVGGVDESHVTLDAEREPAAIYFPPDPVVWPTPAHQPESLMEHADAFGNQIADGHTTDRREKENPNTSETNDAGILHTSTNDSSPPVNNVSPETRHSKSSQKGISRKKPSKSGKQVVKFQECPDIVEIPEPPECSADTEGGSSQQPCQEIPLADVAHMHIKEAVSDLEVMLEKEERAGSPRFTYSLTMYHHKESTRAALEVVSKAPDLDGVQSTVSPHNDALGHGENLKLTDAGSESFSTIDQLAGSLDVSKQQKCDEGIHSEHIQSEELELPAESSHIAAFGGADESAPPKAAICDDPAGEVPSERSPAPEADTAVIADECTSPNVEGRLVPLATDLQRSHSSRVKCLSRNAKSKDAPGAHSQDEPNPEPISSGPSSLIDGSDMTISLEKEKLAMGLDKCDSVAGEPADGGGEQEHAVSSESASVDIAAEVNSSSHEDAVPDKQCMSDHSLPLNIDQHSCSRRSSRGKQAPRRATPGSACPESVSAQVTSNSAHTCLKSRDQLNNIPLKSPVLNLKKLDAHDLAQYSPSDTRASSTSVDEHVKSQARKRSSSSSAVSSIANTPSNEEGTEIREFRGSDTSSTTSVVEDAAKTRNSRFSEGTVANNMTIAITDAKPLKNKPELITEGQSSDLNHTSSASDSRRRSRGKLPKKGKRSTVKEKLDGDSHQDPSPPKVRSRSLNSMQQDDDEETDSSRWHRKSDTVVLEQQAKHRTRNRTSKPLSETDASNVTRNSTVRNGRTSQSSANDHAKSESSVPDAAVAMNGTAESDCSLKPRHTVRGRRSQQSDKLDSTSANTSPDPGGHAVGRICLTLKKRSQQSYEANLSNGSASPVTGQTNDSPATKGKVKCKEPSKDKKSNLQSDETSPSTGEVSVVLDRRRSVRGRKSDTDGKLPLQNDVSVGLEEAGDSPNVKRSFRGRRSAIHDNTDLLSSDIAHETKQATDSSSDKCSAKHDKPAPAGEVSLEAERAGDSPTAKPSVRGRRSGRHGKTDLQTGDAAHVSEQTDCQNQTRSTKEKQTLKHTEDSPSDVSVGLEKISNSPNNKSLRHQPSKAQPFYNTKVASKDGDCSLQTSAGESSRHLSELRQTELSPVIKLKKLATCESPDVVEERQHLLDRSCDRPPQIKSAVVLLDKLPTSNIPASSVISQVGHLTKPTSTNGAALLQSSSGELPECQILQHSKSCVSDEAVGDGETVLDGKATFQSDNDEVDGRIPRTRTGRKPHQTTQPEKINSESDLLSEKSVSIVTGEEKQEVKRLRGRAKKHKKRAPVKGGSDISVNEITASSGTEANMGPTTEDSDLKSEEANPDEPSIISTPLILHDSLNEDVLHGQASAASTDDIPVKMTSRRRKPAEIGKFSDLATSSPTSVGEDAAKMRNSPISAPGGRKRKFRSKSAQGRTMVSPDNSVAASAENVDNGDDIKVTMTRVPLVRLERVDRSPLPVSVPRYVSQHPSPQPASISQTKSSCDSDVTTEVCITSGESRSRTNQVEPCTNVLDNATPSKRRRTNEPALDLGMITTEHRRTRSNRNDESSSIVSSVVPPLAASSPVRSTKRHLPCEQTALISPPPAKTLRRSRGACFEAGQEAENSVKTDLASSSPQLPATQTAQASSSTVGNKTVMNSPLTSGELSPIVSGPSRCRRTLGAVAARSRGRQRSALSAGDAMMISPDSTKSASHQPAPSHLSRSDAAAAPPESADKSHAKRRASSELHPIVIVTKLSETDLNKFAVAKPALSHVVPLVAASVSDENVLGLSTDLDSASVDFSDDDDLLTCETQQWLDTSTIEQILDGLGPSDGAETIVPSGNPLLSLTDASDPPCESSIPSQDVSTRSRTDVDSDHSTKVKTLLDKILTPKPVPESLSKNVSGSVGRRFTGVLLDESTVEADVFASCQSKVPASSRCQVLVEDIGLVMSCVQLADMLMSLPGSEMLVSDVSLSQERKLELLSKKCCFHWDTKKKKLKKQRNSHAPLAKDIEAVICSS